MNQKYKTRTTLLLIVLIVLLVLVAGCMREPEVCNYDGICTDDETDNCADCINVIGRVVAIPDSPNSEPIYVGN